MALFNVRLQGDGSAANAHGANLPTYRLVTADYDNNVAIVDVPEHVLGLTADDLKGEQAHPTTEGDLYTQLSADNLEKVRKHLKEDYPSHEFALELVNG